MFEAEASGDNRPRALIARARSFSRGELNTAEEIRRRFAGGVSSGDVQASAAMAAARAAGQAVGVCHMGAHALGATAYAVMAAGLADRNGPKSSKTRSAGSSSTCPQRYAPRCKRSRRSVRTPLAPLGPGCSPQASSTPSSATCKRVSATRTRCDVPHDRRRPGTNGLAPHHDFALRRPPGSSSYRRRADAKRTYGSPDRRVRARRTEHRPGAGGRSDPGGGLRGHARRSFEPLPAMTRTTAVVSVGAMREISGPIYTLDIWTSPSGDRDVATDELLKVRCYCGHDLVVGHRRNRTRRPAGCSSPTGAGR